MKRRWLKMVFILVAAVIILIISALFILGNASSKGSSGAHGVKDGRLAECRAANNCVSSQSPVTDTKHYLAPWTYQTTEAEALAKLTRIIESAKGGKIISTKHNYIRAEFTSSLFRFVDDVEFYIDADNRIIHFRSASRVGDGDMGVNRKRMEQLKQYFESSHHL